MLKSNAAETAKALFAVYAEWKPLDDKVKLLKSELREIGPQTYEIPGGGKVRVSEPGVPRMKGTGIVFHEEVFQKLDDKLMAKLISLGVVSIEQQWTKATESSVTVTLP